MLVLQSNNISRFAEQIFIFKDVLKWSASFGKEANINIDVLELVTIGIDKSAILLCVSCTRVHCSNLRHACFIFVLLQKFMVNVITSSLSVIRAILKIN